MSGPSDNSQSNSDLGMTRAEVAGAVPVPVVLVVEDHLWTRKAVGRKLQAAGFGVILASTAADALAIARGTAFHVLVADLHLPDPSDLHGMNDGFAMLDWLRRQLGPFRFSIVVHTSQRSDYILQKAAEHGVFAVCQKQQDLENLLQAVAQAVHSLKASP